MKKIAILIGSLTLAGALAGCGGENGTLDADMKKPPSICPQAVLVPQAREIQNYGGRHAGPDNIVVQARMDSLRGACVAGDDATSVDIDLTLLTIAQRGPRYGDQEVSFPFFVAVADAQDHVVTRQAMVAHFDLSETRTARDEETLHISLPLPVGAHGSAAGYRVLAGFKYGPSH